MARLKFMESSYGAWLDGVLDRYADFMIILFITIPIAKINDIYWIIGISAIFASFMISYTGDKYMAAYGTMYKPKGMGIPITRDVRLFLIFLCAVFNVNFILLVLISTLGNAEAIRRIIELKKCNFNI